MPDRSEPAFPRDLDAQAELLRVALERPQPPAGKLLGLPELPDGDMWCDMAGVAALTGLPPRTISGWLTRRGPREHPFPQPDRVLYRLYWPVSAIRAWHADYRPGRRPSR